MGCKKNKKCNCDENSCKTNKKCKQSGCKDCKCKKPNSETVRDDGVFCRKCNEYIPYGITDGQSDGKRLCYKCEQKL